MPRKLNLSATIFAALKDRIIRWTYPPGHRLTEEELCQEFGVSRAPVREALRMLAENNLVEQAPHRGCMVKLPDFTEVHELYDVRLALELFVVERLAQSGLEDAAWRLLHESWQSLLERVEDAPLDNGHLAHEDVAFHEALAQATGNRSLYEQLRMIDERLYFTRLHDITTAERLRLTCEQHLHILVCIRNRDVEAAQQAMRANIEFGRSNVEQALKEALARAYLGKTVS